MQLVSFTSPLTQASAAGLLESGRIYGGAGESLIEVIGGGHDAATQWARHTRRNYIEQLDLAEVELLAPVPEPPSVRDYMAFEQHARSASQRLGRTLDPIWYEIPAFYFTNPAAVCPADGDVCIPPLTQAFDYELEVAAIIGKPGHDITVDNASDHIAGYTILVDWSSRDLQAREIRAGLGPAKGKDSATSLGPFLVTPDELESRRAGKGFDAVMRTTVNGREYSLGNWSDIHWSFEEMVAYASRGTHLRAGDVLGSGTVGSGSILEQVGPDGSARFPYLKAGDEVIVEIEGLGASITTICPPRHSGWTDGTVQHEAGANLEDKPLRKVR